MRGVNSKLKVGNRRDSAGKSVADDRAEWLATSQEISVALGVEGRPSATSSNQGHEDSRVLLSETLEDVLLDLLTDRLRGLLPELAISARDTFPQLDRGKLADLMAS